MKIDEEKLVNFGTELIKEIAVLLSKFALKNFIIKDDVTAGLIANATSGALIYHLALVLTQVSKEEDLLNNLKKTLASLEAITLELDKKKKTKNEFK